MKSFSIKNFKSFALNQNIPLKPITLIYGANSAGKSSVIHSYLLLNHILKTADADVKTINTSWDSVDIGGYHQYSYKHQYDNSVEFSFEIKEKGLGAKIFIDSDTDENKNLTNDPAYISSVEIAYKNVGFVKLSRMISRDKKVFYRFSKVNLKNESFIASFSEGHTSEEEFEELSSYVSDNYRFDLTKYINGIDVDDSSSQLFKLCIHKSENEYDDENSQGINEFFNFVSLTFHAVFSTVKSKKINYVGPLRDYPPRIISNEQNNQESADQTWSVLLKNKSVRDKVNKCLGNESLMNPAYELQIEQKINPENFTMDLIDLIMKIDLKEGYIPPELKSILQIEMDYDDETGDPTGYYLSADGNTYSNIRELLENDLNNDITEEAYSKLVLFDKRAEVEVSLRDVGVGISQVLPVLVNAYSSDSDVVAIEQPEIHLHPKLQSELADVFIEAALANKNSIEPVNDKKFLIETHSEHLLLRIMRRIRETTNDELEEELTPISAEDVQILFVMPSENNEYSIVKKISLRKNGELKDKWPGGFFEESFNEMF